MYNTTTFELAMNACSYKLDHIFYAKNSSSVRKVYGQVPIPKKVTISGERKTILKWKTLRWNDAGNASPGTLPNDNENMIFHSGASRSNKK